MTTIKPGLEIPGSRPWVRVKKPQECLLGLFCSLLRMNKHAMPYLLWELSFTLYLFNIKRAKLVENAYLALARVT